MNLEPRTERIEGWQWLVPCGKASIMSSKRRKPKAAKKEADTATKSTAYSHGRPWGLWAAAVLGFAWFRAQFDTVVPGPSTLWPTHIDWLMRPDWDQHYLGSCFARLSNVGLFNNSLPHLLPGLHTTVGLVDANPWLTLVLKMLNPVLPVHFQLLGVWLCAGFVMQGYIGAKVARVFGASQLVQALSGALLVTAPILLQRVGHDSLCVHWVIVAMLYALLMSAKTGAARRYAFVLPSAFMLFVSGLHPYLAGMLAPLYGVAIAQAVILKPTRRQWGEAAFTLVATSAFGYGLAVWAGFLGAGAIPQGWGFGHYSANVMSLVDPRSWSRTLTNWPQIPSQEEGFGFMGLGALALVAVGLGLSVRRKQNLPVARGLWWAVLAVAACEMIYAIGPYVLVGDTLWANWEPYAKPVIAYLSVFRCAGRFIWVMHYALWLWALGMCLTRLPRAWHAPLLAGFLLIQLYDTTPDGVVLQRTRPSHTTPPLNDALWGSLSGQYTSLVMVPPAFTMHERACPMGALPIGTWPQMAKVAYENGTTYNSVSLSRANEDGITSYCAKLQRALSAGHFDEDTVYAVGEDYLRYFTPPDRDMVCAKANQWHICARRSKASMLQSALLAKTQTAMH